MEPSEYFKGALENDQIWEEELPVSILEEEFGLGWGEIESQLQSVKILWNGREHDLKDLYRTSMDDVLGTMIIFEKPDDIWNPGT